MIERLLRSVVASGVAVADTLVHAPAAIVAGLTLGPTHEAVSWLYRDFARVALLGSGASIVTEGEQHLDPRRRYVFVSNHQSNLDPMAILAALPRHGIRFVAKEELGRVPLFGAALRATGSVFVARENTSGDVQRLDEAHERLTKKISVLFFAEGTRSKDGELKPFKRGAAAFALKAGLALVPIGVHGSLAILPRGFEVKRGGRIGVSIGKPIETRGRRFEERGSLTAELHEAVAERIAEARELAHR